MGVTEWHINADEPRVLDYNTEFQSSTQVDLFYDPDPFRSSDHDLIIVGLDLINQILGTLNNDNFKGKAKADQIFGFDGSDRLHGKQGDDLLIGGSGNDKLKGHHGNDTLIGVDPSATTNEFDRLFSGKNSDLFVVGDQKKVFYTASSDNDYAFIRDFSSRENDMIQRQGSAENYTLGTAPTNTSNNAIDLFFGEYELIAVIKSSNNLDLDDQSQFIFV